MSVTGSRGNAGGRTEIINAANAAGANDALVLVRVDITDILALSGVSNAEKKTRALARAEAELRRALDAQPLTDAQLDQQATDVAANVAATKAARPTGNL